MQRVVMLLFSVAAFPAVSFAQAAPAVQSTGFVYTDSYRACASMAAHAPDKALLDAELQLKTGENIGARHCRAMALYALKRYPEAVVDLLTVERQIPREDLALQNYVTRQTARALNLSQKPDEALAHLQQHINSLRADGSNSALRSRLAAETLLERALLRESYAQYAQAIQELDHAISLNPTNEELLLTRARVFIALNDKELARQDLMAVLRSNPTHAEARALLDKTQ